MMNGTSSVYEQTPPVSLTLNHLPFQGRQGHFVPTGRQVGDPYTHILPFNEPLCCGGFVP